MRNGRMCGEAAPTHACCTSAHTTSAQDRPLGFRGSETTRAYLPRIVRDCASPCRTMPPAGNRSCSRCDSSGGSCRWCNLLQAEWEWGVGWEGGDHAHQPRGRSSRGFAPGADPLPDRIKCLNGEVMHPLPRTSDVFLFLGVDAGAALRAKEGLGCGIWRDGEGSGGGAAQLSSGGEQGGSVARLRWQCQQLPLLCTWSTTLWRARLDSSSSKPSELPLTLPIRPVAPPHGSCVTGPAGPKGRSATGTPRRSSRRQTPYSQSLDAAEREERWWY